MNTREPAHTRSRISVEPESDCVAAEVLHQGVRYGDEASVNHLLESLMPRIRRALRRAFRRAADDDVIDAVEDALLEYTMHPDRFDPTRGVPLSSFLLLVAERNLQDRLRAHVRRRAREMRYAAEMRLRQQGYAPESAAGIEALRSVLSSVCDSTERAAVLQWMNGEGSTATLASMLGISHLPAREQQREVKRFKDRIVKRLLRRLGKQARHRARQLSTRS